MKIILYGLSIDVMVLLSVGLIRFDQYLSV